uniref:Ion transport domain-containing protein n=1 Tax=Ditylenchus dipsaci TaxID=166011 RepID=A0A915ENC0_9BILA
MFEQILQLESSTVWNYGQAASMAYPLAKIDTINQETGKLNEDSALSLIVYGETTQHLDLLDGLLEDLLMAKWDSFAKKRWIISLLSFLFYYAIFFMAFMNRPFTMTTSVITGLEIDDEGEFIHPYEFENTHLSNNTSFFVSLSTAWFQQDQCHLWIYNNFGVSGYVRLICEPLVLFMVLFQIVSEVWDIHSIGKKRWWQVMSSFPSKLLYKFSFILILMIVPIRLLCGIGDIMLLLDNMLSLLSVICTTFHFLYFCRAIKFVGPFILMVYTIITRDMLSERLRKLNETTLLIQTGQLNESKLMDTTENILDTWQESILRLFIMTVGEFTIFYRELTICEVSSMSNIGKIMFLTFELIVSLMQFNLLIAMMTRTYELIFQTQKEWKRQWAQVILMVELSISPKSRLIALLNYSRPIGTDKRKRSFVVSRKIDSDTEIERLRREQQAHAIREEKKMILKRRLKDALNKDGRKSGLRPMTSYFMTTGTRTPMPVK